MLLDNQSTVDVFCNSDLLDDIHDSDHPLAIHCNAGIAWAHQRGTLPGYGEVWFYPNGIANILSLHNVLHRFRVTLDTQRGKYFTVHGLGGKDSRFTASESGLFFYDTSANESGMVLVNTVEGNKANYTRTDVLRAECARELQSKLNHPSDKDFIDIVNDNSLRACPVTKRDIVAARAIHGPCVESLQGKTVRRPPHKVSLSETPTLPAEVHERYNKITICGDIMKLNNLSFLVTISRNLHFGTVHYLPNKRDSTVMKAMKKIISEYQYGGFKVVHAVMDGGFDGIEDELMKYGVMYNGTGRDEHVGEVERYIRTVKSKCRCTYNSLKFKHLPRRLVVEIVKRALFWLNAFSLQERYITNYITLHHRDRKNCGSHEALPVQLRRIRAHTRRTQRRNGSSYYRSNSNTSDRKRPRNFLFYEYPDGTHDQESEGNITCHARARNCPSTSTRQKAKDKQRVG